MQHLSSAAQFERVKLDELLSLALKFEKGFRPTASGQTLLPLFLEPSTRTRLSFESAMYLLGGHVFSVPCCEHLSLTKGESFTDTVRILSGYADVMVVRTPSSLSFQDILESSTCVVINGGNGSDEHPSQALVDLFTIWRTKGRIDGLRIGVMGDIKYSRVSHSLLRMLCNYKVEVDLITPSGLECPLEIKDILNASRINYCESSSKNANISGLDILYVLMLEQARHPVSLVSLSDSYFCITPMTLRHAKKDLCILHALPRTTEISPEVDRLPNATYFQQAKWGVSVRAALLYSMLST
jgi:aspartate carbamoyltransferase catalytic subunit